MSTMKTRVLFSSICEVLVLGMATATCFESYLLHGGLGVERVDEDAASIHARRMRDRLARVLGRTRELKGLGAAGC